MKASPFFLTTLLLLSITTIPTWVEAATCTEGERSYESSPVITIPTVGADKENVHGVHAHDMDGDGRNDLVLCGWAYTTTHPLKVFLTNEDGSFTEIWSTDFTECIYPFTSDVNGDTRPDIIAQRDQAARPLIFIASSPPSALSYSAYSTSLPTYQFLFAIGDMDGDGADDLLAYFPNNYGTTNFGWIKLFPSFAHTDLFDPSLEIDRYGPPTGTSPYFDFTGDGIRDLFYKVSNAPPANGVQLRVRHGAPGPTPFALDPGSDTLLFTCRDAFFVHANNDNATDLVVAFPPNSPPTFFRVYINNLDGTFTPSADVSHTFLGEINSVQGTDLDNDGNLDLVVSSRSGGGPPGASRLFLQTSPGSWSAPLTVSDTLLADAFTNGIAVGDWNDDGYNEVMMPVVTPGGTLVRGTVTRLAIGPLPAYDGAAITLLPTNGSCPPSPSSPPPHITTADLNHDMRVDLIHTCPSSGTVSLFYSSPLGLNSAIPLRTDPADLALYTDAFATLAADIDSDAFLDLVLLTPTSLVVAPNTPLTPTFSLATSHPDLHSFPLSPLTNPRFHVALDANNDGDVDIMVAGDSGFLLFTNPGIADTTSPLLSSSPSLLLPSVTGITSLVTANIGGLPGTRADLVWLDSANPSALSFASPPYASITTRILPAPPLALAVGDMDASGVDNDVVVALDSGLIGVLYGGALPLITLHTEPAFPPGATVSLSLASAGPGNLGDVFVSVDGVALAGETYSSSFFWVISKLPAPGTYRRASLDAPSLLSINTTFSVADLNADGFLDMIHILSTGELSVTLAAPRFGSTRATPAHALLPECGGVGGSLACTSARIAASVPSTCSGAASLVLHPTPPSGSRCARPIGGSGYHSLQFDVTLTDGTLDCGVHGGVLWNVGSGDVFAPSTLTLTNVIIANANAAPSIAVTEAGAAVVVTPGSTLVLERSHFADCTSAETGGAPGSTVSRYGGAVRVNQGTLRASDSSFVRCSSLHTGGAIALHGESASLTLVRTVFRHNSVTSSVLSVLTGGGAVASVADSLTLSVSHSVFESNSATGDGVFGGAMALLGATSPSINLNNCSFDGNSVPMGYGGSLAVSALSSWTFSTTNLHFARSTALYGGTLALSSATLPPGLPDEPVQGSGRGPHPDLPSAFASGIFSLVMDATTTLDGSSSARYGGFAFVCGVEVDTSNVQAAGATVTASMAGRFSFQCLLTENPGVFHVTPPTTWSPATFTGVYGPLAATPAVAGTLVEFPPSLASGVAPPVSARAVMVDEFGQEVRDPGIVLSVTSTTSFASVEGRELAMWDATVEGYSLRQVSFELLAGSWPSRIGDPVDIVVSAPSGTPLIGTLVLTACPIGFGALTDSRDASLTCIACAAGSESTVESLDPCSLIPVCSGDNVAINGVCTGCPDNTIRPAANASQPGVIPPCECDRGFWNQGNLPDAACALCPTGAVCNGGFGAGAEPYARAEWFRVGSNDFVECPIEGACLGSNVCQDGYDPDSYLCKDCASGSYRTAAGAACESCPSASGSLFGILIASIVVAAVVAVAVGLAAVIRFQKKKEGVRVGAGLPHTLSTAIVYFQILGLLAQAPFSWPQPPVKQILDAANVANVDLTLFAVDCTVPSFAARYTLNMILPVAFALILLTTLVIIKVSPCCSCLCLRSLDRGHLAIGDVVLWMISTFGPLVFIPLSRVTLVYFDCTRYPNGKWYLDAEPSVECFASDEWLGLLPVALAGLAVYVLAMPTFFAIVLHRHRKSLGEPRVVLRYGALYSVFRRFYYSSGLVQMGKRLSIVVFSVFASNVQIVLFVGLQGTFLASLVWMSRRQPYVFAPLNTVESTLDVVIVVVVTCGMAFWTDEFPNKATFAIAVVVTVVAIAWGLGILVYGMAVEMRAWRRVSAGQSERDRIMHAVIRKHAAELNPEVWEGVELAHLIRAEAGGGRDEEVELVAHSPTSFAGKSSSSCVSDSASSAFSGEEGSSDSSDSESRSSIHRLTDRSGDRLTDRSGDRPSEVMRRDVMTKRQGRTKRRGRSDAGLDDLLPHAQRRNRATALTRQTQDRP